jgi:ribosome-binding protein aMBF1 (putative translation factor)
MEKKRTIRTTRVTPEEAARLNAIRIAVKKEFPPRGELRSLTDQLRDAIRASGLTHYALAQRAGMTPTVIDKFMAGKDVRLETADRLAHALRLQLRVET